MDAVRARWPNLNGEAYAGFEVGDGEEGGFPEPADSGGEDEQGGDDADDDADADADDVSADDADDDADLYE